MSSAVTRAGQKWKEFWGSQITKNPQLEEKKAEVNELNNYFQMADRTISQISQCHTQLSVLYNQCAMIVTKVYEHETGSNKLIATNLIKMFQKVSEFNGDKVNPLFTLKNELKLWFDTIDQLKILLERYQDDRLVYDHYKFKLEDLKSCKDSAKISRNERKFEKAQSTYQNVCLDMIGRMDRVIQNKFSMINTVLSQLISLETDLAMNSCKSLQGCLNFDKDFSTSEQLPSSTHQKEGEQEDNFINKTRKLLSLPQDVKNFQKSSQSEQPRQSQFQETPTPNGDPDPFEEFNKAQAQLAAGFSDAESPALFKNNTDKIMTQDQLKQQFQQEQLKQYQNMKKERKEDGFQVQQEKQQPPPIQQQSFQKPNIQETQQPLAQSQVFASSNPFFQNQEEGNNFRQYQSVIMQPVQAWNPFNDDKQHQQQFKKVAKKNPFDESEVDNEYVPQQNGLTQSQSQIMSQRQTNPFLEVNTEEQIPNQRMFQTYQPQQNSNPFDLPLQQRQQQNIQKNPFL